VPSQLRPRGAIADRRVTIDLVKNGLPVVAALNNVQSLIGKKIASRQTRQFLL